MQRQPRQLTLIELQGNFFQFSSAADSVRQLAFGLPASPAGSVFEPVGFCSVEAQPTPEPVAIPITSPLSPMGGTQPC